MNHSKYRSVFYANLFACLMLNLCSQRSNGQILDGYTDKASYRAGDNVVFFTKSMEVPGELFFNAPLLSMDGTTVDSITGIAVNTQPNEYTSVAFSDGFNYDATKVWTVPSNFASGRYLLDGKIPFIIKGDKSNADIVVVCQTNTEQAYNAAGGSSFYDNISSVLSFRRPLVDDATHHFMDGFLSWMCSKSYNSNVISDMDLDDFSEIENAKLIIIIGHSEYWTRQARLNFDRFVDSGNDALILSGNTMWWQVRYNNEDPDNPQLVHFGGSQHSGFPDEPTDSADPNYSCDPLHHTFEWNEAPLKYSILGSIGSDWVNGGYGPRKTECYTGFGGYKIAIPGSPLFAGTNLSQDEVLRVGTTEHDGTLVLRDASGSAIFNNGYPQIDKIGLGFYRIELLGYNKSVDNPLYQSSETTRYCPLMLFQKTASSGIIFNTNSTDWCGPKGMGGENSVDACTQQEIGGHAAVLKKITENAIDKLLNHDQVFSTSAPANPELHMKPSPYNVSYSICETSGYIVFKPDGVYMHDAYLEDDSQNNTYKIDNSDGTTFAKVGDCISCAHSTHRMSGGYPTDSLNAVKSSPMSDANRNIVAKSSSSISILPNPSSGKFRINNSSAEPVTIKIYNTLGALVYEQSGNSQDEIDLTKYGRGVYVVKCFTEQTLTAQKLVVQ